MSTAVVLLSGGLDSATVAAMAQTECDQVYALSVRYGQRHSAELEAAQQLATTLGLAGHRIIDLDLAQFGGSSLTDSSLTIPTSGVGTDIPNTYVPARNTVFLSLALAYAEVLAAQAIYIGVTAVDYSGYPDCRPQFIDAFQKLIHVAVKATVTGQPLELRTPLLELSKSQIIQTGHRLGVDYSQTVSCYQASENGLACGVCDSCRLRREGFVAAGLADPTRYQNANIG
jgi:7-cyano-7-deazaguanine synthase